MGKGGVGKTTVAAAIAIALVDRGHELTLSTTDPAAHITDALADTAPDGLLVERIDPAVETAPKPTRCSRPRPGLTRKAGRCSKRTCAHRAPRRSPYSGAFAATVDRARERIVVLDTAPTGHTLLLLDAAQSYQLEVKRTTPTCQPRSRSCSRARATPSSRGC